MAKKKATSGARAEAPKTKGKTVTEPKSSSKLFSVIAVIVAVVGVSLAVMNNNTAAVTSNTKTSEKTPLPAKTRLSKSAIIARSKTLPCKDRHDSTHCTQLSRNGDCERTPGWMSVMCAASCNACEMLDPAVRCDPERMGMSTEPAIGVGDIDKMFEGLEERYPNNNVTFASRPPLGPWIVTMDNFLPDDEMDALLEESGDLKRSTDQGSVADDGFQEQVVSTSRTSENAWCNSDCENHPLVKSATRRIEELTFVPNENFESFQVLRYGIGQFYRTHHDMSEEDNKIACGPRIYTVFVYLNDVEEGGGTNFPEANGGVTVEPKRGRIAMWPSVMNDNVRKQDPRTVHQALPVVKGIKYGANHWIHLNDYHTPNWWGCTGSFDE